MYYRLYVYFFADDVVGIVHSIHSCKYTVYFVRLFLCVLYCMHTHSSLCKREQFCIDREKNRLLCACILPLFICYKRARVLLHMYTNLRWLNKAFLFQSSGTINAKPTKVRLYVQFMCNGSTCILSCCSSTGYFHF